MIINNQKEQTNLKTSVTYKGNGTQKQFDFPFDYLRKAFVKVSVNNAIVDGYTIDNRSVIFNIAPASNDVIVIYRETPTDRLVAWRDASIIKATDMTVQQVQELHILEETRTDVGGLMGDCKDVLEDSKNTLEEAHKASNVATSKAEEAEQALNSIEAVAPAYAQTKEVLDNVVTYTNTAKAKAEEATSKAEEATSKAVEAGAKALESANSANASKVSAEEAQTAKTSVDATAKQLTDFIATKETLTAPAVDKSLTIEGAAADSKVVGEALNLLQKEEFVTCKISEIINATIAAGKNASIDSTQNIAGLGALDGFSSAHFKAERDMMVFFPEYFGYVSIIIVRNFTHQNEQGGNIYFFGDSVERYRTVDNNLPINYGGALKVNRGDYVLITTRSTLFDNVYVRGVNSRYVASTSYINNVLEPLKKETIDVLVPSTYYLSGFVQDVANVVKHPNKYDNGNSLESSSKYDSYTFIAPKNFNIYFDSETKYLSITAYVNGTISQDNSRGRRRSLDGNLPNATSPYAIKQGDMVVISCEKFDVLCYADNYFFGKTFADDLMLNTNQLNQLQTSKEKKMIIRYLDSVDARTIEKLCIYTPSRVGYVRYDFVRTKDMTINADVWRMDKAVACNNNLSPRFEITTNGEWECALHLKDRPDFSGGAAHGDEIMSDVKFFVDGVEENLKKYRDLTSIKSLEVVQVSTLYDPNDNVTPIAIHGSAHIFKSDNLTIRQSIKWLVDETITSCYLAMHLPAKAITDTWYCDSDFVVAPTTNSPNFTRSDTNFVCVYGKNSGITTSMEITEYPKNYNGKGHLLITDNRGGIYNKCYFVVTEGDAQIKKNTLWKSTAVYKFEVGK